MSSKNDKLKSFSGRIRNEIRSISKFEKKMTVSAVEKKRGKLFITIYFKKFERTSFHDVSFCFHCICL